MKGIRQNCYKLLKIVNNTIDISKLEAGFVKLSCENLDIVSIVKDICISVEDYTDNKGIKLDFISAIESKVIAFDQEKVERIILNLLSNAIKFTPKGGCITVGIRSDKDKVYISVKDTGIGIPEGKLDTVFDRYVQVPGNNAGIYSGSGIGLSLVKALVELHGGQVFVKSVLGSGSEFTIELPAGLMTQQSTEAEVVQTIQISEQVSYELSDIY